MVCTYYEGEIRSWCDIFISEMMDVEFKSFLHLNKPPQRMMYCHFLNKIYHLCTVRSLRHYPFNNQRISKKQCGGRAKGLSSGKYSSSKKKLGVEKSSECDISACFYSLQVSNARIGTFFSFCQNMLIMIIEGPLRP